MRKFVITIIRILRGEPNIKKLVKRGMKVGRNFSIQGKCIIDPSWCWLISIGDEVTFAPRVTILAHDASTKRHLNYAKIGLVEIGNKTFIGSGAIILPNVKIGDNCIVGAGSIVTKDVPSGNVVAGNPARVICTIDEYIEKNKKLMKDNVYGEDYTLRGKIDDKRKNEMFESLKKGIGFVK